MGFMFIAKPSVLKTQAKTGVLWYCQRIVRFSSDSEGSVC